MNLPKRVTLPSETEVVDVAIVGAGFGGLGLGIRLKEAGRTSFVILEKANEVGGTWRDNTYPGCACDVQSHLYSYSFEGKPDWSKRYAPWDEIQRYILDTTEKYGLRPHLRFGREIDSATFDETTARWTIRATTGETVFAKHFVLATGPLHVPSIPKIPGLERFRGKVFHSAQWDHDYDLTGKKVVSIGTGGSAIQYVPKIAPKVERLHVFQRSAAWVIPRDERTYSSLEKEAFRRFPTLRKLHRARLYWTNESRVWPIFQPALARAGQKLAEAFIRLQVEDKEIARKLTPDYTIGCKRVLISNEYFPTFNRKNVELVTEGIEEVREHSIVTEDGVERPCDCIILGTGFIVDPRIYMKSFELVGRGGRRIQDDWKDAAEAYYGVFVHGYPNMYQLVGPNTGLGHNSILFMIEAQVRTILESLALLDETGCDTIEVKKHAQEAFNRRIEKDLENTVWTSGCTSWYQQEGGKNVAIWPASTWRYWLETRLLGRGAFELGKRRSNADTVVHETAAAD